MIKQCASTNINSRSECDPYDNTGFLPLIVSPMYSCIDKHNVSLFLSNKIKVCMPRGEYMNDSYKHCSDENYFDSYSLSDFIDLFIKTTEGFLTNTHGQILKTSICIDTAAGHLTSLHKAIRNAKQIHSNNLIIMAGNVGSVEAFVELAKTGCDYIRVGIGGGGGCNTTSNTGVGQYDLYDLITFCKYPVEDAIKTLKQIKEEGKSEFYQRHGFGSSVGTSLIETHYNDLVTTSKVKIVADGISSYINYCQKEYNFNDNGYAAINKLLDAGADLVMVGKLFAQCLESSGEKGYYNKPIFTKKSIIPLSQYKESPTDYFVDGFLQVKYSGMSTQQEQKKYKDPFNQSIKVFKSTGVLACYADSIEEAEKLTTEHSGWYFTSDLRPSEGSVQWIPVRWTLNEWLNGSDKQDESPYLMGFVNALKSMMAYTNRTKL